MKDSLWRRPLAAAGACAVLALVLPASALAAMTIGADLSGTPGTTVTCSPSSACDLSQLQTAGTNEVAPFDGVVVRWRVKGFSGPMKLRVIRPFGGSSFTFVSSGAV